MTQDIERKLYNATLDELLKRVEGGEASAADIANAIKFLKDNNINSAVDKNPKLQKLSGQVMPFATKKA